MKFNSTFVICIICILILLGSGYGYLVYNASYNPKIVTKINYNSYSSNQQSSIISSLNIYIDLSKKELTYEESQQWYSRLNWSQECQESRVRQSSNTTTSGITFYDLGESGYVVQILCGIAAYQGNYNFVYYNERTKESKLLKFSKYRIDKPTQLEDNIYGLIPGFDNQNLNTFIKTRGVGDCGSIENYVWNKEKKEFITKKVQTQSNCELDSEEFKNLSELQKKEYKIKYDQWPIIYENPNLETTSIPKKYYYQGKIGERDIKVVLENTGHQYAMNVYKKSNLVPRFTYYAGSYIYESISKEKIDLVCSIYTSQHIDNSQPSIANCVEKLNGIQTGYWDVDQSKWKSPNGDKVFSLNIKQSQLFEINKNQ